jgi:hypothetical protein
LLLERPYNRLKRLRWTVSLKRSRRNTLVRYFALFAKHIFHVTVQRIKFLILKPTRFTNFLNLLLEWNSTCCGQFLCPSSGFLLYTQQWYMPYRFTDSLRAGSGWNSVPIWSCSQAVSKPMTYTIAVCTVKKTPDDGQRNCPKHVEFYFKNKFEKSVHLVGFIIRNLQNILKRLLCVVKFSVYAVCWQKFPIVFLKAYEMIKRKFITNVGIFDTACVDTSTKIFVIALVSW